MVNVDVDKLKMSMDVEILRKYKEVERGVGELKELIIEKKALGVYDKEDKEEEVREEIGRKKWVVEEVEIGKEEKEIMEEEEDMQSKYCEGYEDYKDYIVMVGYCDIFYVNGKDESEVMEFGLQQFKDKVMDDMDLRDNNLVVKVDKMD